MPWEKSFNESKAIDDAMKVFWEKGYEPASMAELIESTGINRGSLYNAFGGKKQLFIKALLKYDKENRQEIISGLEKMDDPVKAIHALFDAIIAEAREDTEKKGCFLVNTASELAGLGEEVNNIVTKGLDEMQAFLRRCIEVGQARKEIPNHIDPAATAKSLFANIVAIRVLARGVFGEKDLIILADQAKRLLA